MFNCTWKNLLFLKYKYLAFNFGKRFFSHGLKLKLKSVKFVVHIEPGLLIKLFENIPCLNRSREKAEAFKITIREQAF